MTNTVVLLHGSATGSMSWKSVSESLVSSGAQVFAPDVLGYADSPAPSSSYSIDEEVMHLVRLLDRQGIRAIHRVTHSLGALIGLHLRRALRAQVTRMTFIDPIVVSILRECGEGAAYAEMEEQYQQFMRLGAHPEAGAPFFVDYGVAPARGMP